MATTSSSASIPPVASGGATVSARRRWLGWHTVSEGLVLLALAGGALAIPTLAARNRSLTVETARAKLEQTRADGLSKTFARNIGLNALNGARLPNGIAPLHGTGNALPDERLLFIYTPMVCEKALHDGLTSLREFQARPRHSGQVVAIVGERDQHERDVVLLLKGDALMPFPVSFVNLALLRQALYQGVDSTYEEEPLYVRLNADGTIRSAFHADQQRPELLNAWLHAIP